MQKIFIVIKTEGQYEDKHDRLIEAHTSKEKAEAKAEQLQKEEDELRDKIKSFYDSEEDVSASTIVNEVEYDYAFKKTGVTVDRVNELESVGDYDNEECVKFYEAAAEIDMDIELFKSHAKEYGLEGDKLEKAIFFLETMEDKWEGTAWYHVSNAIELITEG
jgi:hypothetical protein